MSSPAEPPAFAADVEFLKKQGDLIELALPEGRRLAVSPKYQARVMTSAVSAAGRSLGWVNRAFIESRQVGTPFDNYGGEDRFWLGPEGGQFSVFFAPGAPFELSAWQTPSGFQEGTWEPRQRTAISVDFQRDLRVHSRSGTTFDLAVERRIALMDEKDVAAALGSAPSAELEWVAFRSDNRITNTGKQAWSEQTGLISIWSLGMFVPADDTWVLAPFETVASGPLVNSDYFGALPPERLRVDQARGVVQFLADGRYRSKVGLPQARSKPVAASYTASENRLTIIRYPVPREPRPYVNSTWQEQSQPFAGDLFNAYCHGTMTPGPLADVRFYELESSSPGAVLAPGESLSHEHQTFHFLGARTELEVIASRVLGVSLSVVSGT